MNDILGIFGAIITLAIVATVVASPNTSSIIGAWTTGFGNDIKAAKGG
jgi:predicted small secreted protein